MLDDENAPGKVIPAGVYSYSEKESNEILSAAFVFMKTTVIHFLAFIEIACRLVG